MSGIFSYFYSVRVCKIYNLGKLCRTIGVTETIRNFMHQKVLRRFLKLQISIAILKHPRWVKLGTLFCYSKQTKTNFLATARTEKNTKEITLFQEQ
jgi:hypothetical protein